MGFVWIESLVFPDFLHDRVPHILSAKRAWWPSRAFRVDQFENTRNADARQTAMQQSAERGSGFFAYGAYCNCLLFHVGV